VNNPQDYGVIEFDQMGRVISLEEKPKNPKSNFAVPGIYFMDENASNYSSNLKPSTRGELEITDLLHKYLRAQSTQCHDYPTRNGLDGCWNN